MSASAVPCIDVLQLCVSIVAALTAAIHTSASGDDTSAGVEYTPDADGTQPRASSSSLEALHAALGASRIAVSGGSIANRGACFSALRAAVQAHAPCVQVLEIQPAQDVRTLGDSTEEVQLPDDVVWVNCAAHETEHAVLRSLITQQPTFAHAHAQVKRARWSTQTSRLSMLFLLPDFHLFLQQSLHASAADGSAVDEQAALLHLIRWWSCPRCFLARLPHEGLVTRNQPSALSVTTDDTPQPAAVDVVDCATAAACAPPGPFACAAAAAGGGVPLASAVVMSYGHRHALVREHVLLPPVCAHLQLDGAHAWAANGTQSMPSPSAAAPTWALSATPTVTEAQRTAWLQRVHSSSTMDGGCCAGTRASASPLAPGDACTRLVLEGMRLGVPLQAPSPDAGSLPASAYSSLSDKWGARTLERFEFGLHCQIAAEPALGVLPERGPIIQHIEAAASTVSGADTVPAVEQESSAHADSVLWGSGVAGYADTKRSLMRDVMEPVWAHLLHEHGARISRPVSPRSRANVHHILSNSRVSHLAHNMHVMKIMPPTGLLFHGPSGCGKTLLAKALARALGTNYLFVHCPMLLSKYVGDSEANVRDLFSTARGLAPCVLLLDEISSLGAARTREAATRGGTSVHERVLSTLLNELDGVGLKGVSGPPPYILTIGTASRHTDCDPALLRPGRLPLHVPLHLPDACDRMDIVRVLLAKADAVAAPDVLAELVAATHGASAAAVAHAVEAAISRAEDAEAEETGASAVERAAAPNSSDASSGHPPLHISRSHFALLPAVRV